MESKGKRLKKALVTLLAAVICFAAPLTARTLCLCDPDPDGCGRECHDCGGETAPTHTILQTGDPCTHLILHSQPTHPVDTQSFAPPAPDLPPISCLATPPRAPAPISRAHQPAAPPGDHYRTYSTRLCPLA